MIRRDRNNGRTRGRTIQIVLLSVIVLWLSPDPAAAQAVPPTCPAELGTEDIVSHDFNVSFCELCDVGSARIVVENPFRAQDDVDFSDIVIQENLLASGLTYVPGSTTFSGSNITLPTLIEPAVGGPNGSILTWTLNNAFVMPGRNGGPGNTPTLVIDFEVRRHTNVGEEGLVGANRSIEAAATFTPSCAPADRFTSYSGAGTLPLREPEPTIIKRGRNVDAGQGAGSYTSTVYAHENDDVIWRIQVRNDGLADLQDFVFSDSIVPGNFEIDSVCDSEADATAAANGAAPARCRAVGGTTDVLNFDVAAAFGGATSPYIVAPAGGSGFYYLIGRVTDSCTNRLNSVFDVEWGCEVEAPAGGIAATSTGSTAGDTAQLNTQAVANSLDVDVALTGTNTGQPMGAKGTVTITLTNTTGGTIKGGAAGIRLRDVLPAEYVVDPTFAPTVNVNPAYGNTYPGMIDTLEWTNPVAGTFPLVTNDPALPLANTDLQFVLTSSSVHQDFADQFNMVRHGDVVTVTLRTVLIDPQYYDKVANLDVRTEEPASDPPGTDPPESFPISNQLEIWFEEFCTPTEHHLVFNENDVARPEDLDIDIIGTELVFILTSTGDPLPLTVALTNNGGHDADDYSAFVTFGEAMVVQTAPSGCSPTSNPPSMPAWQLPTTLPGSASVYVCDRGVIRPGETERLDFEVVKNTVDPFDDDLTFRADVTGEITLSDGTPLWFPTPTARPDGITNRANDYTLDAVRARVIGYDLLKEQLGVCSENLPPLVAPDVQVEIGEECSFHVESGGWFGFQTPGFTYIAVQNIQVVDEIPDGQGYISSTDPLLTSTPAIQGVQLNPPPVALGEDWFDWVFNSVVPAERITEKDHWFRVDIRTRLLNDPIDTSAAPNQHAAPSSNIMTSTFEAIFHNPLTNLEELYNLGPSTVGFPREVHRRVDLTVTEPLLSVTKEVCNETRYGAGAACSNFVALADDGDAFDTYVYRVTVANEASSSGVPRAPAYDVSVTSVTDPSDQLLVDPLVGDTLDNDGDALIDAGDLAGEGVVTDSTIENGIPAEVIASYTHSDALLRIDAGQSAVLYYRVDPDDDVAPLQQLTSTVSASYDSLEGASGAQSPPQETNGAIGGARQYVSAPAAATIQIIPVEVRPKQVVRTASSALAPPGTPQPVSIGEEVEFGLRALIPVAQLRGFTIRDELPAGLSCSEAPAVNLDAPPYAAAGFTPGGTFTPTCTETEVVWSFGNQTVTQSPRVDRRFDFAIQFIARVDNVAANQDGDLLRNGGAATVTTVRYIDEAGSEVVIPIDEATLIVQEPLIALTKAFSAPAVDAADRPRVTVTAINNGTSTAYDLRVLDDLSAVGLAFVGEIAGTNPPSADIATFGPDRPLFNWDPNFAVAPGETVSFSFAVEVYASAEPLEILPNTIEADWRSLADSNTSLNSSGQIGADGSATGLRNGSLPNAADPLNDYEAQANASVAVPRVSVAKVDLDPALAPEIGAHKPFQVEIALPEGSTQNLVLTDDLSVGSASYVLASNADFAIEYEFDGILSINGQPASAAAFSAVPADGASGTAVWSIGSVVTATEDDFATQALRPAIRIRYRGRINNDLATNAGSTLQNTALLNYTNGETGVQETETAATAAIVAIESSLTATKVLANVTPGKAAGDPPAFGDTLQYVVTIVNGGNATAYDANIVDTLPPELTLSAGFTPTAAIDGTPVAGFASLPTGAPDGPLVWGRENGDENLDIAASSFLELTYQVEVRTPMPDAAVLENRVWTDWTSREAANVYERTGDACPTITPPDDYCFGPAVASGTSEPVAPPDPLLKENTQATASVGEAFRYRITIPATPYPFPLYDVRILDDLAASAADLRLLSVSKVSGSAPWTPVNSGTATDLMIEDPGAGIDIPTGEQIVLEIAVVLEDTPANVSGLAFTNTATHTYNWIDGNDASQRPGLPGTTAPMTIVGADVLTLTKSGPSSMTIGTPATFTLDVHNASSGPAWNATILDQLPDGPTGGTCDVPPSGITAQVFEADGTTPVSALLAQSTDFTAVFSGQPACELRLGMLSAAAMIDADQRLIVQYETRLDFDTQDSVVLTNVAGAIEWFSTDGSNPATAGDRHTYVRALTDGTVGLLDHEDAHSVDVALPTYTFEKTVVNVTSGESPATSATPGDTLRYQLRVENLTDVPLANFALFDELDRLNAPPVFQAGTLQLLTVPSGADTSNTSNTGGVNGSGVLDVRNLSLPGMNDSLVVEFEIELAPVIANATLAMNQSQLRIDAMDIADSDDPNVNGPADPMLPGDEDPTQVLIVSAPDFRVEKTSAYLTGDPSLLLATETLRYTITVKNIGSDDATDVVLRDAIPVNTRYLAGSTTLNGALVADGPAGAPPLVDGIQLHAPEDPTPGAMRADASATVSNVATLRFDVIVDANVVDGTVISNQAFVSAVLGGVVDQPSDDPRTATPDDPTRDVVGNAPLLFAPKSVAILVDGGTPGIVDPGDVLHYTITVQNSGAIPATGIALADSVPANTIYVADSLTLNGLPVGQPDGGISPLVAGIPISSSDLTPPLPAPGAGVINTGQSAMVEFDLQVNAGVPGGTLISNQAVVSGVGLPNLLTDGDGNPATGPEPTVVVVGNGQQLAITKQVAVVGGGAALAGAQLEYVVNVVNISAAPATDVVITDDLDLPMQDQLSYVAGSATLNASPVGVTVVGSILTADYSTANGPLQPGQSIVLRFRAAIDASLAIGTTVTNTGVVSWNDPAQTANASVSIDVGGMPGVGLLNGRLWHDADFDKAVDVGETALESWTIELLRNGAPVQSVQADSSGAWQMGGLAPNDVNGDQYALRFRAPGAGAATAALGRAHSVFVNGLQEISGIVVPSGANLQGLNLPIDPNGVVYGSVSRTPVAGTTLTMLSSSAGAPLPTGCFDDPAQQGQVTGASGYYKFDLNFSDAACQSGGTYRIEVTAPGAGFVSGTSQIIPPTTDASMPAFPVPSCPGTAADAVTATAQRCEAQASALAPAASVSPRSVGTQYHVHLLLDSSQTPGSSQLFNNHIALDPVLDGAVAITKTTPSLNVSRGDLVPYEITLRNQLAVELLDLDIVDDFPAGFRYIEGSARIDGAPREPMVDGLRLTWENLDVAGQSNRSLVLLFGVGAGVGEGKFVNRAHAVSGATGVALSGEATATVRVVPDPTFACTDVMGKVFDDANRNGSQDHGDRGLPGVRLVTARGLVATTDPHGRFHITCAVVPNEDRGSNFVLKLDDRTLPTGYRMSNRQVQVKRATSGKALRFNFAASIDRVVGLDLADAVFEPGSTEMREQWKPRLGLLLDELANSPATLRLAYVADVEDARLVERRLAAVKQGITRAWKNVDAYELTIESEVFWRRGASSNRSFLPDGAFWDALISPFTGWGSSVDEVEPGEAVERHLPIDRPFQQWALDPDQLATESGDRLEEREVITEQAETVKLTDVVPPIRFASGVADIPASSIARLHEVLEDMQHLDNVRLHLVGHADDQPLSGALAGTYGDNTGLSRERAGEAAEFLQQALALPPEAISFGWAGETRPLTSNATAEGRALNRRVEVEVWYDEIEEKVAIEDAVIPEEIKRVKVCRTETVCKLRYREGNAQRARIKNLVPPLHYREDSVGVPDAFVGQISQAFHNLRDEQNVTVKIIGFTDDVALTGRAERIYGTHLSLSKARARRVALAIQDELDLPTAAIASDGRGAGHPLASNDSERGRALNRRIEVEFWYDDPLQELSDEPQMCPDAAGAELVTRVYDPPWGGLAPLPIENGDAQIPAGYAGALRRAMADLGEKTNVRLRFLGYTRNEHLDRRTARVYGDDIGLSAARARRTMERIQAELGISDAQAEHEGRGYVHSNDVVNGGFIQGDTSHVIVQVVYDELAVIDDTEGVDVTRITRETRPRDALALNLMHITVDGEPLDDPGRSSEDIQRCTDVALEQADIRFRFDDLGAGPRLSVRSFPATLSVDAPTGVLAVMPGGVALEEASSDAVDEPVSRASSVQFRAYSNYPHFIERSEVRIFERGDSLQSEPLDVVEVGPDGIAQWQPPTDPFASPMRELQFVLRAHDAEGRFDETAPQPLWLIHGQDSAIELGTTPEGSPAGEAASDPLLAGYAETGPIARSIPLGNAGAVQVHGSGIPPHHTVWFGGAPVPVDEHGNFVAEAVLPVGLHTVEVAVLDPAGNGELFLRDLELKKSDWFYIGIADLTVSTGKTSGNPEALDGEGARFDRDSTTDGRLAFYVKGKFGDDWSLTASADTREGPVQDLFDNFLDKSPGALFRRIDPDYHYPTFGDDGSVVETAPTSGKLFVELRKQENRALWGNFKIGYLDNELAQVDRGLYGANLHYQSVATTRFGEQRVAVDGFAAEPGTVPSREEFRGTGGSLYYLRRQDLLQGSERVRIELRDKDSGLVTGVVPLEPTVDYDIDYLQGRILLSEPIAGTANDDLLVRSAGLTGNEVWLVVRYEFTPGFGDIDALTTGGQAHWWLNDFVRLGATANYNDDIDANSLYAGDLTARKSAESWVKLQVGRTEGLVSTSHLSDDGGFNFLGTGAPSLIDAEALGYRADASIGFRDLLERLRGRLSVYYQKLEAGYSAPGLTALTDTQQYGGQLAMPLSNSLQLTAKGDRRVEEDGLATAAVEVDARYQLSQDWGVSTGVRYDQRDDNSPLVPATQEEGERTDGVVEVGYDSNGRISAYAFGQATLAKSGEREANNRGGLGGAYRVADRLALEGEVSYGNLGPAVKLGTSYQETEDTHRYFSYAIDGERGIDGTHARRGNLISGARTRLSDSSSVYIEDHYQHSKVSNSLSRSMGMTIAPTDRWTLGANWEFGTLIDQRTNAETRRNAGGARASYLFEKLQFSTGIEYRSDDTEQLDESFSKRTTWLFRNNLKFQMTPDWRLIGKFNHSFSDSSLGEFFDGGYTEAVLGYAFRPVSHDRLNALAKYTYFYNFPTTDQVTLQNTAAQFIQKSHIASIDVTYDLTRHWAVGGKYAYRRGEVSLDREDPDFFDNSAHLFILRTDWQFLKNWETSVEGRMLYLPDLDERKSGALVTLYRYLGNHFKIGIGYNFTDFSEDLTDLSYDHHGFFFNMIGTL